MLLDELIANMDEPCSIHGRDALIIVEILLILSSYATFAEETPMIVGTEPEIRAPRGATALLPCNMTRKVNIVIWKRGATFAAAKNLVELDLFFNIGHRSGPEYNEGTHNITDDYSLVVNNVTLKDEGRYFCHVQDAEKGKRLVNDTILHVYVRPTSVIPQIGQCRVAEYQQKGAGQICHLVGHTTSTLNCSIHGYYPTITLYFHHMYSRLTAVNTTEWDHEDGTKSKSIIIRVVASDYPYICIVSDVVGSGPDDGDGIGIVFVTSSPPESRTEMFTDILTTQSDDYLKPINNYEETVIVSVFSSCILFLVPLAVFIYLKFCRKHDKGRDPGSGMPDNEVREALLQGATRRTSLTADEQQENEIGEQDVRDIVRRLIERHCWRLENTLIAKKIPLSKRLETVIDENKMVIFDTREMLIDWLGEQTCNKEEKLSKILSATTSVRGNIWKNNLWICDNEIDQIAKCLARPRANNGLFHILSEEFRPGDDPREILRRWRDYGPALFPSDQRNKLHDALDDENVKFSVSALTDPEMESMCKRLPNKKSRERLLQLLNIERTYSTSRVTEISLLEDLKRWRAGNPGVHEDYLRMKLHAALAELGFPELLAVRKPSEYVYKTELAALVKHLFMMDISPLAKHLGIAQAKLEEYKRVFDRSHLDKGSYYLMAQILQSLKSHFSPDRMYLSTALRKIGYTDAARMCLLAEYCKYDVCKEEINSVLNIMDHERIKSLANMLNLQTEENDSIEVIRSKIFSWTRDWKSEMDKICRENSERPQARLQDRQAVHRDFNDELVEKGFYDFAYNVMVLELHVEPVASNMSNGTPSDADGHIGQEDGH